MERREIETLVKIKSPRITLYRETGVPGPAAQKTQVTTSQYYKIKLDSKDVDYVACTSCKQVFKYVPRNGTTTLARHTRECHKRDSASCNRQRMLTSMPTVVKPKVPDGSLLKTKSAVAEAAGLCCAKDLRPFHFVAGDGFAALAQELINVGAKFGAVDARTVIPHEKTVASRVRGLASERRATLRDMYVKVSKVVDQGCPELC